VKEATIIVHVLEYCGILESLKEFKLGSVFKTIRHQEYHSLELLVFDPGRLAFEPYFCVSNNSLLLWKELCLSLKKLHR